MSTSAIKSRFPIEIIGKIWKLTNIAKMGLTADQPQSPMKIIKQMLKSANITKISPSGTQCRYPMKTITMLSSFHCSGTLVWLNSRLLQIVFNSLKGGEIFVNTRSLEQMWCMPIGNK